MNRFAAPLDRLILTPQRNVKLRLIADYFRVTPDPDRGFALAGITGDLAIAGVKPAMLRGLIAERMDPVLFRYSYDYVGDLAETIALAWPEEEPVSVHSSQGETRKIATLADIAAVGAPPAQMRTDAVASLATPTLSAIVEQLQFASRLDGPRMMARWLDQLDASG